MWYGSYLTIASKMFCSIPYIYNGLFIVFINLCFSINHIKLLGQPELYDISSSWCGSSCSYEYIIVKLWDGKLDWIFDRSPTQDGLSPVPELLYIDWINMFHRSFYILELKYQSWWLMLALFKLLMLCLI